MTLSSVFLTVLLALLIGIVLLVLGFALYVWLTIRDIKEMLAAITEVKELAAKKQYAAILMQPKVYEQVMQLIANRFGFLAPIGVWILRKLWKLGKR